jgi:N-acetylglucosaminyldiphosphoundecaprenol N-acetyl-beta-D-mannosaminyltransferase
MEQRRQNILGFGFDFVSYDHVINAIHHWRRMRQSRLIALVNPFSVLLGHQDKGMAKAIRSSSLVLPDGVGIVLAAALLGDTKTSRITGPTLMLKLCDASRQSGLRHYFYGGSEQTVKQLVSRLSQQFPGLQIAGWDAPPFRPLTENEDNQAVQRINAAHPDIVWVGLGAPKQEKWMLAHLGKIHTAALIGVGAAFDFHAGTKKWAPSWMRRCGLEWLHRLCQEPGRMARRNWGSLIFLRKVLRQAIRRKLHPGIGERFFEPAVCILPESAQIAPSRPQDRVTAGL